MKYSTMSFCNKFFLILAVLAAGQAQAVGKAGAASRAPAAEPGRYFYEGDGKIDLGGKRGTLSVTYRGNDGTYSTASLKKIDTFFGMPSALLGEGISLRLIAMIDYLQDKFAPGKTLTLRSGYRSPEYNTSLRKKGKLAAKTSYHMEGMAADLVFPGASPQNIWDYVKNLDCCGIGIYGGKEVHLDSGKPRFWTAETALPKEDVPPQNRNIYLAADKDIYYPGETLRLFFSGVSDYPFGVKVPFKLKKGDRTIASFTPEFKKEISGKECVSLDEKRQARLITWKIPEDLNAGPPQSRPLAAEPKRANVMTASTLSIEESRGLAPEFFKAPDGKLNVEVEFCDPVTEMMPPSVASKPFVIKTRTAPSPRPPR
ncbi:MAG: DUF882 domain-containing protein [Deltaproteobacteria bacterium]|nr:DUF882 domain-containing protein [Deltaproteobacteria bacterium]